MADPEKSETEIDDDIERERIGPQNLMPMNGDEEFSEDFSVIEEIQRLRILVRNESEGLKLPNETALRTKPRVLLFKDFQAGNTYCRRLTIFNQSIRTICLRYHSIEYNDEVSKILDTELQIETLDIARIKPGLQISIQIEFSPRQSTSRGAENNASLVFTTWSLEDVKKGSKVECRKFRVPVRCLPCDKTENPGDEAAKWINGENKLENIFFILPERFRFPAKTPKGSIYYKSIYKILNIFQLSRIFSFLKNFRMFNSNFITGTPPAIERWSTVRRNNFLATNHR